MSSSGRSKKLKLMFNLRGTIENNVKLNYLVDFEHNNLTFIYLPFSFSFSFSCKNMLI